MEWVFVHLLKTQIIIECLKRKKNNFQTTKARDIWLISALIIVIVIVVVGKQILYYLKTWCVFIVLKHMGIWECVYILYTHEHLFIVCVRDCVNAVQSKLNNLSSRVYAVSDIKIEWYSFIQCNWEYGVNKMIFASQLTG